MSETVRCADSSRRRLSNPTFQRIAAAPATRRMLLPAIALLPAALALVARWTLGSDIERDAAVAGFCVGALVGLTGMGSGALMTPVLILVVGVPPVTAVGTDLTYAALTKVVGGWQHARQGSIDGRLVRWLATGSIPGSLVGVAGLVCLQRRVPVETLDTVLRRGLSVVLLVAAAALVVGLVQTRRGTDQVTRRALSNRQAIALGAVVGFLVGLTSVGSGSLVIAALSLLTSLPAVTIVGTDVAHAALLTSTAALAHAAGGNVDLELALSLLAGSLPGVLLGSAISIRIPPTALRFGLAGILLASALALF